MNELATAVRQRNLAFVKDLLMDGNLFRVGLVDRQKLEAALSVRPDGVRRYLTESIAGSRMC